MNRTVYLLCSNRDETIVEYSLLSNKCGKTISNNALCFKDEDIIEMSVGSNKIALVGSFGTLRIFILRRQVFIY